MNFKKKVSGSWTDTPHYIHNTSTDTLTTLPAVLYPNGTTATVGLKGQAVQSSVPSPTSPVMPQGTGERTGNLVDVQPFTIESDGASHNVLLWSGTLPTGTYTISLNQDDTLTSALRNTIRLIIGGTAYYESATENYHLQSGQHKMTFTISDSSQSVEIRYWGNTFGNECSYSNIMLNLGSAPLPYENFGYKIPISSANTTTPVYLGEVQTTRKIKKLVLDGTENILLYSVSTGNLFRISLPVDRIQDNFYGNGVCSHYKTVLNTAERVNGTISGAKTASLQGFVDIVDDYSTIADFKAYLAAQYAAGTPVTIWYVLAEPETGIVNEPLMRIGDYADTLSGITIPVTAGANTISVGTTLQPSEVTANYKGWHPVADVHERTNGTWT